MGCEVWLPGCTPLPGSADRSQIDSQLQTILDERSTSHMPRPLRMAQAGATRQREQSQSWSVLSRWSFFVHSHNHLVWCSLEFYLCILLYLLSLLLDYIRQCSGLSSDFYSEITPSKIGEIYVVLRLNLSQPHQGKCSSSCTIAPALGILSFLTPHYS